MTLLCPKCQKKVSLWFKGNGKVFPCTSCGAELKITSPAIPILYWFLPPILDILFYFMFAGKTVISLAHEQQPVTVLPAKESSFGEVGKMAQAGNVDAQVVLGNMYFIGDVCERNFEEAYFWHSLAVKHGKPDDELDALKTYLSAKQIAAINKRVDAWIKAT